MHKFLKAIILVSTFYSLQTEASIITFNGYSRATDGYVINGTSQQWLRFDQTLGKSIEWFLDGNASNLAGGGWRLATNENVLDLFNTFFPNPWVTWDATENFDTGISSLRPEDLEASRNFVELFSITNSFEYIDGQQSYINSGSFAFYGSDKDSDGEYKRIAVRSGIPDILGNNFGISLDRHSSDTSDSTVFNGAGLALVRDLNYIQVSSPSTTFIMIFSLIALLLMRYIRFYRNIQESGLQG